MPERAVVGDTESRGRGEGADHEHGERQSDQAQILRPRQAERACRLAQAGRDRGKPAAHVKSVDMVEQRMKALQQERQRATGAGADRK